MHCTVIFGGTLSVGNVVSSTVIICTPVATLTPSFAVQVRVMVRGQVLLITSLEVIVIPVEQGSMELAVACPVVAGAVEAAQVTVTFAGTVIVIGGGVPVIMV